MNKIFQNYYTESYPIKEYMVDKLDVQDNHKVLEPCGGTGEFIDSLLALQKNIFIDTFDINKKDIAILNKKYSNLTNITITEDNTLTNKILDNYASKDGEYDRIIGNPPYGGWLDYDDRKTLKKKYGDLYVKETYLLFLIRSLSVLKNLGKLTFIIPDTFLYLNSYKTIREYLLSNTRIVEVLIFPSKLFSGIHFGYSKLSIITLEKNNNKNVCLSNRIKIVQGFKNTDQFKKINHDTELNIFYGKQNDILESPNSSFILNPEINTIINSTEQNLSNFADCVTGIYTGNNKENLAIIKGNTPRASSNYKTINPNQIDYKCTSLKGIQNNKEYIPIVKGSPDYMYKQPKQWAIKWRKDDIKFYQTNKKARFQNSTYYFKHGIAIPMVKSKKIKAIEMNNSVFDQSIVGIFPFQEKYFNYILALLNSEMINNIIHIINPTANNSANYLKRIPIKLPNNTQLNQINNLVTKSINTPTNKDIQPQLDRIINKIYKR